MDDSAIMCDGVIELCDEDAEAKPYDETNFNQQKATCKNAKFLYFACIFISYYSIIDSC